MGKGKKVSVSMEELEEFGSELSTIVDSLEKVQVEAEKIASLSFYTEGQAKTAVSKLKDVPAKYGSAIEHYTRLYELVGITWQTMKEADEKLSKTMKHKSGEK